MKHTRVFPIGAFSMHERRFMHKFETRDADAQVPQDIPDKRAEWHKIADALVYGDHREKTADIFKTLDTQFSARQINMNDLKSADGYTRNIAMTHLAMTAEQLKAVEPRSMNETHEFIRLVRGKLPAETAPQSEPAPATDTAPAPAEVPKETPQFVDAKEMQREVKAKLESKTPAQRKVYMKALKKSVDDVRPKIEADPTDESARNTYRMADAELQTAKELLKDPELKKQPSPDWLPSEARQAWESPDTWERNDTGGDAYAFASDEEVLYRHDEKGALFCIEDTKQTWTELPGEFYDNEKGTRIAIPAESVFNKDQQRWDALPSDGEPNDRVDSTDSVKKPPEALDVIVPDWVPHDAADAFRNPDTWKLSLDGVANIRHGDAVYRHSYDGRCEVYDANGTAQLEGKYFDAETNAVKDIPKNGVFNMKLQKWEILSLKEEASRIAKLAGPIQKAKDLVEALENGAVSDVQNYEKLVNEQNWFQGFTNWLTDFKPYDMQLQTARIKLAQIRNAKDTFNERFDNAESFRDSVDAANSLFKSLGMAEITDGMVALAPESTGLAGMDTSYLDIAAQNESNMEVSRDAIVDTTLTVGTLGAGALVNLGRKGAMMGGRQVIGTLSRKIAIRQGAISGATLAGASSGVKNVDNVASGKKTVGEAIADTATDTTVGAAFGSAIGLVTPSLQNGLRRIFEKVEARAAAAAADDAARMASGAKPASSQFADDMAKATKEAEELARKEVEAAARAAKEAEDALRAKAAKEAEEALQAKAAKEAEEALRAKTASEAKEAAAKAAQEAKDAAQTIIGKVDDKIDSFKDLVESNMIGRKFKTDSDKWRTLAGSQDLLNSAVKIFDLNGKSLSKPALDAAYLKLVRSYHPDMIANKLEKPTKALLEKGGEYFKGMKAAKDFLDEYLKYRGQPAQPSAVAA